MKSWISFARFFPLVFLALPLAADTNVWNPTGNVGVGTTTPSEKLEVAGGPVLISGTVNPYVMLKSSATGSPSGFLQYDQSEGDFMRIYDGTQYSMVWRAGKVGIGTADPGARLHVAGGQILATSGSSSQDRTLTILNEGQTQVNFGSYPGAWSPALQIQSNDNSRYLWIGPLASGGNARLVTVGSDFDIMPGNTLAATFTSAGNVGIGTTNPTQKLSVNGTIRAKEVIVDTGWSDYVFADDYRLAPLSEIEKQIKAERHLPDIPSAQEVAEHGVSMGEMQSKLLAKIEELTLHVIAQEKRAQTQEKRTAFLESENEALCREITSLKNIYQAQ